MIDRRTSPLPMRRSTTVTLIKRMETTMTMKKMTSHVCQSTISTMRLSKSRFKKMTPEAYTGAKLDIP